MTINKYQLIEFTLYKNNRGELISIESGKNINFDIKRIFYILNTPKEAIRGEHALKKGKQLLVTLNGSCEVFLDTGMKKENILLNNPSVGLLIEGMVWREIYNFSENCILLVISDTYFDENDYVFSYEEFKKLVLKKENESN